MKRIMLMTLLAVGLFSGQVAAAGNLGNAFDELQKVGEISGTSDTGNIETLTGRVIRSALTLVGILFFALMVYAGFLWMTARGEEAKIEKAQNIIKAAVIGLVIVVSAYAITVFVTGAFENP